MDIEKEIEEVITSYPRLNYFPDKKMLIGEIEISEGDVYNIRVDISPYPVYFPVVYEIDDRIPKKLDRHIYTGSGDCCLTTTAKAQILLKTKVKSLKIFFDEVLVKYLENNSYYEIHSRYFDEEYLHGPQGIVDAYKDILGIQDMRQIVILMINRVEGRKLRLKDACYCGSGLTLKKCNNGKHSRMYKDFRAIDKGVLINDLTHFENLVTKN
ncbi:hypothetical protein SAMN02927921_01085 [Sinomicrobium oceani]|uniref:SEC-C motif-containing protein n=1 Tax=Sinomicrobium oceani TaxID=1150368 RepID=A0A1K1N7Z9_9FLAO|nr:hypothetical protein [Sinomicrobium oceani]SFW31373.1 hypothetical protein SAMN02927921_01085 [Sinomicrobium oceani]